MCTYKPSKVSSFREARVISPSPAMLEKGKQLKKSGKTYQYIGGLLLFLGLVTFYLITEYGYDALGNNTFFYAYSVSGIFFLIGIIFGWSGAIKVSTGEKMFEDILIPSDFSGMNGHEFNDYIVKIYRTMDYTCKNLPKSGDRGADFLAQKDGVSYVVQTKRWKNKISDPTIQKLVGAKSWYGADKAICVTNSDFTKPAKQWENRGVELINGRRLDEMIIELQTKNNQEQVSTRIHNRKRDFPDEVVEAAWVRSDGRCECERNHSFHPLIPSANYRCFFYMVKKFRGKDHEFGWEAYHIDPNGPDTLSNCEILCQKCYKTIQNE